MSSGQRAAQPPRPVTLTTLAERKALGEPVVMVTAYDHPSARVVDEAGVDVVNDGEVGKPSFSAYVHQRLSGFEPRPADGNVRRGPIDPNGRDAQLFPDYYAIQFP